LPAARETDVLHKDAVSYSDATMARMKELEQLGILTTVCAGSALVRHRADIVRALLVDHGGSDHCSESRKQLIKRFAAAAVLAEQFEAQLMRDQKIDTAAYSQLCNTLVRIAHAIGINHRRGDAAPRLADLLHSNENDNT
jgi:hypothetical protein